ncbi:unnamed protein product [Echinostoma caproni]|uniref:Uncharacterized protein n=1 Tax=Echinostoma caproni TaxID=27848 RepID=A0A182ZZE5_9TREM|nr:unnamed protein product [Echinostoma caproni]
MEKSTDDLSPPIVKPALCAEGYDPNPTTDQPPLFIPGDDFDNWKLRVGPFIAGASQSITSPMNLSFLREEASHLFHSARVLAFAPAPQIRTTLRKLSARTENVAILRERLIGRHQPLDETVVAYV